MTGVLTKREDTEIHPGKTPCDNRGRDRGDAATSQGTPRTASHHPKLEEAGKDGSLWGKCDSVDTLSSDSGLQNCCFKDTRFAVICCGSPKNQHSSQEEESGGNSSVERPQTNNQTKRGFDLSALYCSSSQILTSSGPPGGFVRTKIWVPPE